MKKTETAIKKNGDEAQYTLSTLFKAPHPALFNRSYGESFYHSLAAHGYLKGMHTFLEVGGGHGYFAKNFLNALQRNNASDFKKSTYILYDVSSRYLSQQKKVLKDFKRNVSFVCCDALRLPFKNKSFKGIVFVHEMLSSLGDVLPEDVLQFMKEMGRVCKKGSLIFIVDRDNRISFSELYSYAKARGFKGNVFPLYRFLKVKPRVKIVDFKSKAILKALEYRGNFLCMAEEELKQKIGEPFPELPLQEARRFFGYNKNKEYKIFIGGENIE